MPRNPSDASTMIAVPMCAVMIIRNGATQFGSTWRSITRISDAPMDRAGGTYMNSLTAIATDLITRDAVRYSGERDRDDHRMQTCSQDHQ